jgi:hypothetical protein
MKNLPPVFRTEIVGRDVTNILLDEEGLGISLVGGWNISVWSAIALYANGKEVDLRRISELTGASLLKFVKDGAHERLVFSNGFEVIVDLSVRKPSQPESMMVCGPKNLIVVWNE